MRAQEVRDPEAFRTAVEPLLLEDEARHNLPLGISGTLVDRPDIYPEFHLWLVEDCSRVVAGALITPPHQLILAAPDDPEVHDALCGAIVAARESLLAALSICKTLLTDSSSAACAATEDPSTENTAISISASGMLTAHATALAMTALSVVPSCSAINNTFDITAILCL